MRILLDECVPRKLARDLSIYGASGQVVETVQFAGLHGVKNGELARRAELRFDVLMTGDI